MTVEKSLQPGIYSPVPTFFHDDEDKTLDLETQVEHAKVLYKAGVSGVLVAGSTGEAVHLTLSERAQIVKAIHDAIADPKFRIITGVVGACIPDICEQASAYKEAGSDSIIVLVPGYYGPAITKQDGLVDWFHKLGDKSPLPVIVYNYPGVQNGIDLTIDSFTKIGSHANIIGCKLTNFNFPLYTMLGQSETLKSKNFTPLSGVGQVLVPSMSVGVNGAIDGISNVFPKCMVEIGKLFSEGKLVEAAKLQDLITKANEMTAATNLLGLKYALKHKYGFGETLIGRPPLNQEMDVSVWKKYVPVFDELSGVEDSL
ncbi:unnamed protein product [Kuraishia capsulata CBS 1993]|uniref:Uncharacterized protein n=1 Tax=Kuraishia capsulata CBS 1993 TaxID=1382522 RepID=W6MPP5_9ASCO|nr:uncharacterized protein KUCA_T00003104001 [Kuraishia capsulata CBS 1993]CDK27127.1 unnamed protein product [Kuraishia capsulata CBS 1993]